MRFVSILLASFALPSLLLSQSLELPPRPTDAVAGSKFVALIESLDLPSREEKIFSEIKAGNVPDFLRKLCAVTVTNVAKRKTNIATFFVTADYLAVGSENDY